MIYCSLVI